MGPGERIEVFRDVAGQHRFRVIGANEETTAQSEGYEGGREAAAEGARDTIRIGLICAGSDSALANAIAQCVHIVYVDD